MGRLTWAIYSVSHLYCPFQGDNLTVIIQQSETIWRFCKRIIFGDFYSQSGLLPVPPVYIISCLSHPSYCWCPRVRQPALNGLLWANFGSINTSGDLGPPGGRSGGHRPGWEGGGLESPLIEWKHPHSTTPLQLVVVVVSRFYGTSTPKGSYSAKTGDNDCNVNSSRYSLSTALSQYGLQLSFIIIFYLKDRT